MENEFIQQSTLLDELDRRQDEALAQLDELNRRIETLLAEYTRQPQQGGVEAASDTPKAA
jgi:hypothetical protein